MKKRNFWQAHALALLCLLTAVSLLLASATMAKYVASGTVMASAKVAKWGPSVSVAPTSNASSDISFWGNTTVFMARDKDDWVSVINTGTWSDYSRTDTMATFLLKSFNAGSEVASMFAYAFTKPDGTAYADPWMHIDMRPAGMGTAATGGINYPNPTHPLHTLAPTLAPGTDGTAVPLWFYVNRTTTAHSGFTNCYTKVKFVWTATQVD